MILIMIIYLCLYDTMSEMYIYIKHMLSWVVLSLSLSACNECCVSEYRHINQAQGRVD